jgi:ComF family protein
MLIASAARALLAFFYPDSCIGCGAPLDAMSTLLCAECAAGLRPEPGSVALPAPPDAGGEAVGSSAAYAFLFRGTARALIHALKYEGRTSVARELVTRALPSIRTASGGRSEAVVHLPMTAVKRRERGFNQSELLATLVARSIGVPHTRALRRVHAYRPHAASGRPSRLMLRSDSFAPTRGRLSGTVLLVDDVVTTGATLAAAAHALRRAGAVDVVCFAFAATPPSGGPRRESG